MGEGYMPESKRDWGTVRVIPLDEIDIGTAQVRTENLQPDSPAMQELMKSIEVQGLLQPIVVVEMQNGRFEVIAGQRRLLAHQYLGRNAIQATVRKDDGLTEIQRTAISLTENLVREDNRQKELIAACTKLYRLYGSMRLVAEETGLSAGVVSQYVKYDQLCEPLKRQVEEAKLDMKVALQAQKAASNAQGEVDETAAVKFAEELKPMNNVQRKNLVKIATESPSASVEETIEKGRKQPVLKQVVVTLGESLHTNLQKYAKEESQNQDEAAQSLIEDGLVRRGYAEEGE